MKRLFFLMVSLAVCFSATAQIDAQKAAAEAAKALEEAPKVEAPVAKPVYWDHSVMTQFNFGQSAFWNWATRLRGSSPGSSCWRSTRR